MLCDLALLFLFYLTYIVTFPIYIFYTLLRLIIDSILDMVCKIITYLYILRYYLIGLLSGSIVLYHQYMRDYLFHHMASYGII